MALLTASWSHEAYLAIKGGREVMAASIHSSSHILLFWVRLFVAAASQCITSVSIHFHNRLPRLLYGKEAIGNISSLPQILISFLRTLLLGIGYFKYGAFDLVPSRKADHVDTATGKYQRCCKLC